MNVALVYDRVNKWGGAERVLLALHALFPNAPLYTSVYNPDSTPWAKDFDIRTSFLQKYPYAKTAHEKYAGLMPLAFENFCFDAYDAVISITSEAAKGIITKPKTMHICYCLTPTRYLWTGYEDYFRTDVIKTISYPAISYLRYWDIIAAKRPDVFIAISHEVQRRIRTYYSRESDVIYPPSGLIGGAHGEAAQGDYFLVVSRLVPYKRIDLAVRACTARHIPLKIVGIGSELAYLKSIAGPSVEFLGNLTDDELIRYYRGCRALLFPGTEDFGIVIVEAQQYGKPVIAYRNGGAIETIMEGKTGLFFDNQDSNSLMEAIRIFGTMSFNSTTCQKHAAKFSNDRFQAEFMKTIDKHMKNRDH